MPPARHCFAPCSMPPDVHITAAAAPAMPLAAMPLEEHVYREAAERRYRSGAKSAHSGGSRAQKRHGAQELCEARLMSARRQERGAQAAWRVRDLRMRDSMRASLCAQRMRTDRLCAWRQAGAANAQRVREISAPKISL